MVHRMFCRARVGIGTPAEEAAKPHPFEPASPSLVAVVAAIGCCVLTAAVGALTADVARPGHLPAARQAYLSVSALNAPIVGGANSPSGDGYWLVATDGGIFTSGDARFFGSTGNIRLNQPIVGMAATPDGAGYWLVATDGGIFAFGDARFFGSTGNIRLNQPIVGMAATPDGAGYWLVATDGGIFAFGDARFFGSTGNIRLNQPIVAMTSTPAGDGYWFIAADGGIFSFGAARYLGTPPTQPAGSHFSGIARSGDGTGYWAAATNGQVYAFGDAAGVGTAQGVATAAVVGAAAIASNRGLRLFTQDGNQVTLTASRPATAAVPVPPGNNTTGSYSYLETNADGTPGRWNPCAAVHYVTNLTGAPGNAASLVTTALGQISAATSMTFIDDGRTSEVPSSTRAAYQPAVYGNRWAPMLVAWSTPAQSSLLPGGNVIGEGGPSWVDGPDGHKDYITAQVAIDSSATANLDASFGPGATLGELLLHELGHAIGLGHTGDPTQIMYPTITPMPSAQYGTGDRAGLGHLGRAAGCITAPQP